MIKYSVMTVTLILLVSILIAQSGICLRHSLLRLMDGDADRSPGSVPFCLGSVMAIYPVTRAESSRIDLAPEAR